MSVLKGVWSTNRLAGISCRVVFGTLEAVEQVVGPENPNQLKCLTFVPAMSTLERWIVP